MMTVLVVSLLLLVANSALSARIAGFHMAGGSQYLNTKLVLEELASRGHEVRFFHTIMIFFSQSNASASWRWTD